MNINTYYVPMDAKEANRLLMTTPGKVRRANEEYSNLILQPAIIVSYKGNAPRKALQGFGIYLIDYGNVGRFFADVAIRKCYGYVGKGEPLHGPQRFGVDSGTIFPLSCKEFETWLDVLKNRSVRKE